MRTQPCWETLLLDEIGWTALLPDTPWPGDKTAEQRLLGGQISFVHTAVRGQQGCWSHTVIMDTVTTHTLPLDNSVLVWQKNQQMLLYLRRSSRQAAAVLNVPQDVPHVQSLPTVSNSMVTAALGDPDTASDTGGSQTSSTTPSFHSSSQTPQQQMPQTPFQAMLTRSPATPVRVQPVPHTPGLRRSPAQPNLGGSPPAAASSGRKRAAEAAVPKLPPVPSWTQMACDVRASLDSVVVREDPGPEAVSEPLMKRHLSAESKLRKEISDLKEVHVLKISQFIEYGNTARRNFLTDGKNRPGYHLSALANKKSMSNGKLQDAALFGQLSIT